MSDAGTDETVDAGAVGVRGATSAGIGHEPTIGSDPGTDATLASADTADTATTTRDGLGVVSRSLYQIERALSRGGMGQIAVATDRRLQRTVAVKEMLRDSDNRRVRFVREAEITAQLQHPSIVPVYEAGYWPDGSPFYAMKLVDGRPLRHAIEAAATLRERLALLPSVVAVADALAYAHARRIIHRDLKPDNILLGEYGETVVIDWGLAKRLGEPDVEPDEDVRAAPVDADLTAAGSMMGTPAYMPPEQAAGEPLDARADVYAIGAVLYHVLAGRVPYADSRSLGELIERVLREPPTDIRALAPEAPPDLLAIVDKAMAREPAARYASAGELAEDLRRFTTGQLVGAHSYSLRQLLTRWVRRHRAAVTIGALAAVALAAITVIGVQRIRQERTVAEQQRTEARAHRADVESLLDFMLSDLRTTLSKTGNLGALHAATNRALDYFTTHDPGDAPEDLARNAEAITAVGMVLFDQGRIADALGSFARAGALADRCLVRSPDHERCYKAYASARALEAKHLRFGGDLARADDLLAELRERRPPARLDPDVADRALAERLAAAGEIALARGTYDDARAAGLEELLPRRRRVERRPEDDHRVAELVGVHLHLALVAKHRWELDAMRAQVDQALQALAGPLTRDPASVVLRDARRLVLDRLGDIEQAAGQQPEALAAFTEALALADALHEVEPTNVTSLRNVMIAEQKVATTLMNRGDLAAALQHQARSMALAERLHQRDPAQQEWARDLSVAYDRQSSLSRQLGKNDDALAFAQRSRAVREDVVARSPDDPGAHRDLAVSHTLIGEMLGALGRWAEAVEAYRAGGEQMSAVIALEPAVKQHQVDACEVRTGLGLAMGNSGDLPGGTRVLEEVWRDVQALVTAPEATDMWRLMYALTARQLAQLLLGQQRLAEAADALRKAVAMLDVVTAAQPDELMYAQEHAIVLALLGVALNQPATRAEAAAASQRARAVVTALVARAPDNAYLRGIQAEIERIKVDPS